MAQKVRIFESANTSPLPKKAFIRHAKDCDGILSFLTDSLDAKLIQGLPRLKIISNFAVGYNNIDISAATSKGVFVSNTPSVLTNATADLTWGLILAAVRHIPQADRFTREGKFKGWRYNLFLGTDIHGKTLGIIGLGRIGRAVAERAKGFGMKVMYFSPSQRIEEENFRYQKVDIETLLKESDIVTLHAPLNKASLRMIGQKELSLMKPTAYLINTARGPILDEKALLQALKNKKIAGAGLDVYENEPKINSGLLKMGNVICLPHIGSATLETRFKMAQIAADNLIAYFKGQTPPPNCVNPKS